MGRAVHPHIITDDSALGGSVIERSLRFNDDDSPWLERAVTQTSNRRTFTISAWIKRSSFGFFNIFGQTDTSGSNMFYMTFDSSHQLYIIDYAYPTNNYHFITNRKFRDTSAWYHIVLAVDTTQATNTNRSKLYVNGVQETSFSTANYPSQNLDTWVNHTTYPVRIGRFGWGHTTYFDGYMTEYNFIDGQQLDPTHFGYTESQTELWRPKRYEGTYGTNGFHLEFKDNSSTTTLGKDTSGDGNDFTANNFSVSAGAGNDSVEDTPTNNWCVWNQLSDVSDITLSEGNLKAVSGADSWPAIFGTHGVSSGKWYYEAIGADNTRWGLGWSIEDFKSGTSNTFSVGHFAYSQDPLTLYQDGSGVAINGTPTFTTGNVLQIAIDIDNGKTWFGINNTWVNASNGSAGNPAAGTNHTITFSEKGQKHYPKMINNLGNVSVNFGQQGFTYTPPDGFQALSSANLPIHSPSVLRPQRHFGTLLYTATGNAMSVTGLEFKPDLIWQKRRDSTGGSHFHYLFDSVRGGRKGLQSNTTGAEFTGPDPNMTFTNNGFDMIASTGGQANASGGTYVAWCWKAGGSSSTFNIDGTGYANATAAGLDGGTANPTGASVNTKAGFSIISYTATNNQNVSYSHGLNQAPEIIITKDRDNTRDWGVYYSVVGTNTNWAQLNSSNAQGSNNSGITPVGGFSGSYMTLHQDYFAPSYNAFANGGNDGNDKMIAYMWHSVPGYSKFGSYTGNGNADGTYVHLGFRPVFLITKNASNAYDWMMFDVKRSPFNDINDYLFPNSSSSEGTGSTTINVDFLSNGFKWRGSSSGNNYINKSGDTFIYMAFAEQPGITPYDTQTNAR
tara:strand:+ start:2331 stop:4853 length:2523 start_codon:yes stop_codon:yes gene_type:complete